MKIKENEFIRTKTGKIAKVINNNYYMSQYIECEKRIVEKENIVNHHDQPGDPDKGGRLIVETIEKEDYPRTLVMGQDALNFVKGVYERKLKELEAWKETSVQSDYSFKR